jgi:hypothetical protein
MKHFSLSLSLGAALSIALGLVATDASAAYSGYIYRTLCPNGSLQTAWNESGPPYWEATGLCNVIVNGVPAGGELMYGSVNIPYESSTASNQAQVWLYTYGANSNGYYDVGQICADAYAYDEWGNFSVNSGVSCSSGTDMSYQWIILTVDVPAYGTVVTNVSGQPGVKLMQSFLGYESNGS